MTRGNLQELQDTVRGINVMTPRETHRTTRNHLMKRREGHILETNDGGNPSDRITMTRDPGRILRETQKVRDTHRPIRETIKGLGDTEHLTKNICYLRNRYELSKRSRSCTGNDS
jgi:hypothetical protein